MHYIIIWPSGSWKDTLIKSLLKKYPHWFSKLVSNASRKKREWEIEGYNYYYLDKKPKDSDYKNYFNYVIYNWNFYWYDWNEVNSKIINEKEKSSLIIVEPSWMQPFADLFNENNIPYRTIFLDIDKNTIIERLLKRWDCLKDNKERIEKDVIYFSKIKKKVNFVINWIQSPYKIVNTFLEYHQDNLK